MAKINLNQDTLDRVRAARAMYLSPGPDSGAPEDWQKRLESNDKRVEGPWTWEEEVRVREVVINEGDGTTKDGRSMDRYDVKLEISEDSDANPGRVHTEFLRIADEMPDGSLDTMTQMSLAKLDQMVQAAGASWEYDDEGGLSPDLTAKEALPRAEFIAKFVLKKAKRKDTGEFVPNCEIKSVNPVE